MQTEKLRQTWIDNLRAVATISVIWLHTSLPLLDKFDSTAKIYRNWWIGNVFDSLVRFCVPVFLMLTGALLLGRIEDLNVFLRKRLARIVIPFIFWNFVYIAIYFEYKLPHTVGDILTFIYSQFFENYTYHLWFVYMLIGIYLFLPILSKWVKHSTEKEISYFLVLWMLTLVLRLPKISAFNFRIDFSYFSGYVGYVVLGYYLSVKEFRSRYIVLVSVLLFLAGVTTTMVGTYYYTSLSKAFSSIFFDYTTINVAISSAGLFLLFKNLGRQSPQKGKASILSKLWLTVSKYSYGVYLSHLIIVLYLNKASLNCYTIDPLLGVPLLCLATLFGSMILVWVAGKLPLGKYISGQQG